MGKAGVIRVSPEKTSDIMHVGQPQVWGRAPYIQGCPDQGGATLSSS